MPSWASLFDRFLTDCWPDFLDLGSFSSFFDFGGFMDSFLEDFVDLLDCFLNSFAGLMGVF